jgi:hypothetical protein
MNGTITGSSDNERIKFQSMEPMLININHDRMLKWLIIALVAIELALVLLDAVVSEYRLSGIGAGRRLFDITREDGIPNFFSSIQLLGVGGVLLLITIVVRGLAQGANSKAVWGWRLVTGLFLFLGFDDGTKLHERIGSIFDALATDDAGEPLTGLFGSLYSVWPTYSWQLVLGPVFAVFGVFLIVFLYRELPSLRLKYLTLLAIGLFGIAEALDFIEGMDTGVFERVADIFDTETRRAVHFAKSIEEFLEMLATTVFLFVFLEKLMSLTSSITFALNPRR